MKPAWNKWFAGLLAAAIGCGSLGPKPAFDPRFADNRPEPTGEIARALHPQEHAGETTPWVVATIDASDAGTRAVVAYDLRSGNVRWRTALAALTRPQLAGSIVVLGARDGEEQTAALDADTGEVRWRASTGGLGFIGAAGDDSTVVYTLSTGVSGGTERRAVVRAVDTATGSLRWEHEIDGVVGAPAVRDGYAFIPWDRQNLVVLRVTDGSEAARLRSTDDVIAWVLSNSSGVFYGSRGVYRFDDRSFIGRREESTYREPPSLGLPTRPLFYRDAFFPSPGIPSARERIRLYAEPGLNSDGSIAVVGSTLYYTYFRFVFAFATDGSLLWVRALDETLVGARVLESGLLTVGERGQVRLLSASTGNDRWTQRLGTDSFASATLVAHRFAPSGSEGEPRDLRDDLLRVAGDPDNGLVAARAYAITQLATASDADVTHDLLELFQRPSMPRALRAIIQQQITSRDTGDEHLLAALERRYDYLEDTQAPPLALIAPALARMNTTEAVPALSEHLVDPETPTEALPAVAEALVKLGPEEAAPTLLRFLRLYHRDSSLAEDPSALLTAASGLYARGDRDTKRAVTAIATSAGTPAPLAEHIRTLVDEAEARERSETLAANETPEAAETPAETNEPEKPLRLSQEAVDRTVMAHLELLRECVADERLRNPQLSQVRLTFIINGDGSSENWRFSPNRAEFVDCATPKVREIAFPAFSRRRMPAVATINLRPRVAREEPEPLFPEDAPWWVRFRARNEVSTGEPPAEPWWSRRFAPQPHAANPEESTSSDSTGSSQESSGNESSEPLEPDAPVPEWWQPLTE